MGDFVPVPLLSLSVEDICRVIDEQTGFYFARFSDGGLFCLWRKGGENCEGITYTDAQADALEEVIQNSLITHGLSKIAIHAAHAGEWLIEHEVDLPWYDESALLQASMSGDLWPLTSALHKKRVLIVGPHHLRRFRGFPLVDFVEVHETQAFDRIEKTKRSVLRSIVEHRAEVVLISAGFAAAPVLVSWLSEQTHGLTVMDVGSIWDMYVGVLSRSGPKRLGWAGIEHLGRRNFHKEVSEWRR